MFVLELTYTVPMEQVQPLVDGHMAWVREHREAGVFLMSGRKVPRDGGVILALGDDRAAMEELVATDPFSVAGVCEYRVTQFLATSVALGLERLKEEASA